MDKMTEQMAIEWLESIVYEDFAPKTQNAILTVIEAAKERQQYRAIENELKEKYHANVDIKLLMHHFIETIFKGEKHEGFCILTNEDAKMWEEYQKIGTVEEISKGIQQSEEEFDMLMEYRNIGTAEELQALKEKSVAKKPIEQGTDDKTLYKCSCGNVLMEKYSDGCICGYIPNYCKVCGQKLLCLEG